ncbi:MAG: hypothetical protein NMNS02_21990 [Nitrosomonas sp.]|nr:MAG: hypothetical protein NMNS02_21990 [Nitrosomonas sp.]
MFKYQAKNLQYLFFNKVLGMEMLGNNEIIYCYSVFYEFLVPEENQNPDPYPSVEIQESLSVSQ